MAEETQSNVPRVRFDGFDNEWSKQDLGDVVGFYSGLTYSPHNVVKAPGTFVLRSSNVKNGEVVDADNVYVDSSAVNSKNVEEGDVIVVVRNGSRALIGKHALIKRSMDNTVIGAFMTGIESEQPQFFNALLDTNQFRKEIEKNLGATINQITTGAFKKMRFAVPADPAEQSLIGQHFTKLDEMISQHQRKHAKLVALKKAMLQKMFPRDGARTPEIRFKGFSGDWVSVILGDIALIKGRLGWKSLKKNEYVKSGPSMIAGKHIHNGLIDWGAVDHIPMWRYEESPEIMLKAGDVIFSKDGSLGNPAVIEDLKTYATINSTMMMVRLSSDYCPRFFYQILRGHQFEELVRFKVSGSSIPHLFQADMKTFTFNAPSKPEQQKIGNYLCKLDEVAYNHTIQITKLRNIKAACLEKMFV